MPRQTNPVTRIEAGDSKPVTLHLQEVPFEAMPPSQQAAWRWLWTRLLGEERGTEEHRKHSGENQP
jgi:hypothetical protein